MSVRRGERLFFCGELEKLFKAASRKSAIQNQCLMENIA